MKPPIVLPLESHKESSATSPSYKKEAKTFLASRSSGTEKIDESKLADLLCLCKKNIAQVVLKEKNLLLAANEFIAPTSENTVDEEAPELSEDEELREEEPLFLKEKKQELKSKKPIEQENFPGIAAPLPMSIRLENLEKTSSTSTISSSLSMETFKVFDKICDKLTLMHTESSSKTILTLSNKEFFHSPFYQAEITLEEFSTAPKIFNVTIKANDTAVTLLQSHMAGFMQVLADKKLAFGINRIDTDLLTRSSSEEQDSSNLDKEKDS